jgi:hypothetical protein
MWIQPPRPGGPIECLADPDPRIRNQPRAQRRDRRPLRRSATPATATCKRCSARKSGQGPGRNQEKLAEKPAERTELRWGFWRLWDDHSDECWQHVVYVGNEAGARRRDQGRGLLPADHLPLESEPGLAVGPRPAAAGHADAAPGRRTRGLRIEHAEMSLSPPIGYPDDSFAAIEQGLEPGMAYPMRVGSEAVVKIYEPPPSNPADYQYEEKEKRLRRGFFVDFPEQTGDTPPTLGQWLDEMARAQRRIGRPGLPFWREGPAKIFLRFKYLLEKAGAIKPIVVDGKAVSLMPYNPTQRAAEQQEIAMAVHGLQIAAQMWPEEYKLIVDGGATMQGCSTRCGSN